MLYFNSWVKPLCLLFFLGMCFTCAQSTAQEHHYNRHYLSGKDASDTVMWDFKVSAGSKAGAWDKIRVPSNWELQGFGTYNYGHDHKNPDRELGKETGSYKHSFAAPADWKGKVVRLVFEGAMTDTRVKINGNPVGEMHQGGFYRFAYDISKWLKPGSNNLLEVEVDKHSANASVNRAEREADFWIFGGIFRPVYLEVLPKLHLSRIAIDAKADGTFRALLNFSSPVQQGDVRVDIIDPEDNKVLFSEVNQISGTEGMLSAKVDGVKSWNPESPHLYKAVFTLLQKDREVYSQEQTVGFRTVELRQQDGFYVNGKRVVFKGVNRHSFHPNTGRALSDANHLEDILLMMEMNMNAVRMSHYPPDERFLDLCDSLGMFVLNEVAGWQQGYDLEIGPKVIKATVLKDGNHPSVVIWDHGNEGGWDFGNEQWFHAYDIQKRPVIYPWLKRNGVDTHHYFSYNAGIDRLTHGQQPFMPTEFMHGLYDGGHGAGLDDYWKSFMSNPRASGGFLWVFADEAVVRTDQGGKLDADGNHAPDGILGPYKEKEGSFYTIKNIWSPIQIQPAVINSQSDGRLLIQNGYLYTSLDNCRIKWSLRKISDGFGVSETATGKVNLPAALPGEVRNVDLGLPEDFADSDWLTVTAYDWQDREVYSWNWPIHGPADFAGEKFLAETGAAGFLEMEENEGVLEVIAGQKQFHFDLVSGKLLKVLLGEHSFSLANGPEILGVDSAVENVNWELDDEGNILIKVAYSAYPKEAVWTVHTTGLLSLDVQGPVFSKAGIDYLGIGFDYPEAKVKGVKWIGNGPYRVWKNRLKGAEFGVWEKAYNNTVTGYSYEKLEYPEFKGYHAQLYALELQTEEGKIRIISETPNLYFKLYNPENPPLATSGVTPVMPPGDLAFLHQITPIGNKFSGPETMGPSGQKANTIAHTGDTPNPIKLWFDFFK